MQHTCALTRPDHVIQGQTFTVIGAAGELPKPPEKPIVFLEGEIQRCRAHVCLIAVCMRQI